MDAVSSVIYVTDVTVPNSFNIAADVILYHTLFRWCHFNSKCALLACIPIWAFPSPWPAVGGAAAYQSTESHCRGMHLIVPFNHTIYAVRLRLYIFLQSNGLIDTSIFRLSSICFYSIINYSLDCCCWSNWSWNWFTFSAATICSYVGIYLW